MKKGIIIIITILASITSRSQDIIILYSGEKIEAKVTEVSETEIRFKKWSNLSGPDWVKKMSDVERIKYQKDRLLKEPTFAEGKQWDFRACGSSSKTKSKRKRCVSGNEIVAQIDLFYSDANYDMIQPYIESLPSCVSRDCIYQYYYEKFLHSCDDENEYGIIRYGETYLNIGGEAELPMVLSTVAKMYAIQGNETETERLIKVFEKHSEANDDFFEMDIAQLRQETYDMLHPRDPEENFLGKWVTIEASRTADDKNNPLIIEINNVKQEGGINLIPPSYHGKFKKRPQQWQIVLGDPITVSQGIIFDASNQLLITRFASEVIKDRSGNEEFARSGIEEMRNTRANLMGEIVSSSARFEDKILYSGATILTTSLIEGLFKSSTISSKSVEAYTFAMMPNTPVSLDAAVSHVSGKNVNGAVVRNDEELNRRRLLVKWEESDSVYFVSSRYGFNLPKPITFQPIDKDDPLLWKYNQIRKQEKTGKLIAGLSYGVTASTLTFFGVKGLVDHFKKGKPGLVGPIIELGVAYILVVPYSMILTKIKENADDGFSKINIKNRNKLIQKAEKAEKKLSLAPCYDPETNAIGASVNINF